MTHNSKGPQSRSSFRAYAELLEGTTPPIANRAQLIAALEDPNVVRRLGGATVDEVRHALKQRFRGEVLDRMTHAADGAALSQAESWQRMRDMTLPLNSSDRGNLTEDWYAHFNAPDAQRHVRMDPADFPDMTSPRYADIVGDRTLREVKSGDGPLSPHDLDQFDDYMAAVAPRRTATIGGEPVQRVQYTLTSPDAAIANAGWMESRLADYPNLTFELFDRSGVAHRFGGTAQGRRDLRRFIRGLRG